MNELEVQVEILSEHVARLEGVIRRDAPGSGERDAAGSGCGDSGVAAEYQRLGCRYEETTWSNGF